MKIGVSNTIPNIVNLPGQGGIPPVVGDFIELEPNSFLIELENSTDLVELE
tara:strand:- start:800 stop:952 length:153 start_codon:yes stop_codon:yes gene_type:complete